MSAVFWVGIAIAICAESIRLGPGSLSEPGPGLLPLGCGLALGIFGLILYISTFKISTESKEVVWEQGLQWGKIISALVSMIGYAFLVELLGFSLVTLLWMGFICKLGKVGWKSTVFISVVVTFSCFILFVYCLGIRFPRGIFWF